MGVWCVAAGLWAVVACLSARLLRIAVVPMVRSARWTGPVLVGVACLVLLRPHEEIVGGLDGAAYVHTAHAIARHGHVQYRDPLLSEVPLEARRDFLFGHRQYGDTKFHALVIRDLASATMAPRFQPAFSLLLSPLARGWISPLTLYVTPLFVLLGALAARALAASIFRSPALGWATFALYAGMPLLVWHGRAARPEVVAAFLTLGGAACLWRPREREWDPDVDWGDAALGAVALALAPFFHVLAWWTLAGMCAVVWCGLWLGGCRRRALLFPAAAAAVAGFLWQCRAVTDHYGILRMAAALDGLWPHLWALGALVAVAPLAAPHARRPLPPAAALFLTLAVVAAVAVTYFATPPLAERKGMAMVLHHVHPTDLRLALRLLGGVLAAAGAAGWIVVACGGAPRALAALGLAWLPGALLVGYTYDFFMTRYLLLALVPLLVLGLAALLDLVTRALPHRESALGVATALLLGLAWWGRGAWATTTEYQGVVKLFRSAADIVRRDDGILLVEYARFGAPFEHMFRVPTLALDNERKHDYRRATATWTALCDARPERPAYLLTPFAAPELEGFRLTPAGAFAQTFRKLEGGWFTVPRVARDSGVDFTLHRLERGAAAAPSGAFARPLDAGNLGLAGFANLHRKAWPAADVRRAGAGALTLQASAPVRDWLLLLHAEGPAPTCAWLEPAGAAVTHALGDGWHALQARAMPARAARCSVPEGTRVLQAYGWAGAARVSLAVAGAEPDAAWRMPAMSARWSRAEAAFRAPWQARGGVALALLDLPAGGDKLAARTLALHGPGGVAEQSVPTEQWRWEALRLDGDGAAGWRWNDLRVRPAWDSGLRDYPSDLGARVAILAVLPPFESLRDADPPDMVHPDAPPPPIP